MKNDSEIKNKDEINKKKIVEVENNVNNGKILIEKSDLKPNNDGNNLLANNNQNLNEKNVIITGLMPNDINPQTEYTNNYDKQTKPYTQVNSNTKNKESNRNINLINIPPEEYQNLSINEIRELIKLKNTKIIEINEKNNQNKEKMSQLFNDLSNVLSKYNAIKQELKSKEEERISLYKILDKNIKNCEYSKKIKNNLCEQYQNLLINYNNISLLKEYDNDKDLNSKIIKYVKEINVIKKDNKDLSLKIKEYDQDLRSQNLIYNNVITLKLYNKEYSKYLDELNKLNLDYMKIKNKLENNDILVTNMKTDLEKLENLFNLNKKKYKNNINNNCSYNEEDIENYIKILKNELNGTNQEILNKSSINSFLKNNKINFKISLNSLKNINSFNNFNSIIASRTTNKNKYKLISNMNISKNETIDYSNEDYETLKSQNIYYINLKNRLLDNIRLNKAEMTKKIKKLNNSISQSNLRLIELKNNNSMLQKQIDTLKNNNRNSSCCLSSPKLYKIKLKNSSIELKDDINTLTKNDMVNELQILKYNDEKSGVTESHKIVENRFKKIKIIKKKYLLNDPNKNIYD